MLSCCVNMDGPGEESASRSRRQTSSCWFSLAMSSLPQTDTAAYVPAINATGVCVCVCAPVCLSSPPPWHVLSCPAASITIATQTATDVTLDRTRKPALAVPHMKSGTTHNVSTLRIKSTRVWCCGDKVSLCKQWLASRISGLWAIKRNQDSAS